MLETRLEEAVVCAADAVVCASEISAEHLRAAYPEEAEKVRVIANGFEAGDLTASPVPPAEAALRIVHTGSFSFSHPRRTPEPLFAALRTLVERDASWSERLQVLLVGALSAGEEQAAADLVERKLVQLVGLCEREAALEFQRSAHVLLVVDHVRPWPASNVPGKFYEYLAMRRPLLSLGGSGMVERLISELNAGVHVRSDDPRAIGASIEALYARFSRGQLQVETREEDLRRFHRRELTQELARCFDGVVETR
jgi:glycosyltransferase involved in cell wall biosynthesis